MLLLGTDSWTISAAFHGLLLMFILVGEESEDGGSADSRVAHAGIIKSATLPSSSQIPTVHFKNLAAIDITEGILPN
jgi:hypothetical protein